jgi:hypothetical protein
MVPLVAATVTVEVPTGVPGSVLPPPLPLPPPPQPAIEIRNAKAIQENNLLQDRRLETPLSRKTPASVAPTLVVHQPEPSRLARWAAVVEMVSVVEPLPVTEAGLKLHVASLGNPVHDVAEKLTVPL